AYIEEAVGPERNAMPVVPAAVDLRLLPPNHGEPFERGAPGRLYEPRASDGRARRASLAALCVADVDEAVRCELGVQHHVAEAALAAVLDGRDARNVDGLAAIQRIQLQRAALLRDEQAPVGQERHR